MCNIEIFCHISTLRFSDDHSVRGQPGDWSVGLSLTGRQGTLHSLHSQLSTPLWVQCQWWRHEKFSANGTLRRECFISLILPTLPIPFNIFVKSNCKTYGVSSDFCRGLLNEIILSNIWLWFRYNLWSNHCNYKIFLGSSRNIHESINISFVLSLVRKCIPASARVQHSIDKSAFHNKKVKTIFQRLILVMSGYQVAGSNFPDNCSLCCEECQPKRFYVFKICI